MNTYIHTYIHALKFLLKNKRSYSLYFIFLFSFFHSQISDTSNSIFIGQESTIYVTSDTDNFVYAYSGNETSTHLNTHTSYKARKKENQLPVSRETSKNLTTSSERIDDRCWDIPPLEPTSFLLSHTGSGYSIIPFSSYNFKMLFTDTSQKVLSSSLILSEYIKHKLSYNISYYFEIFIPFSSRPPPVLLGLIA
ncbi:hypothetical protein CLU97_4703 [Chryseobacterium sp. 7]|nr:hypothetical protein CLU97_4703 [Chryseobacterium sp. 7]